MYKSPLCLALGIALCAAAQSPRPEIRGFVLEPGTNQPVAEAEVTLEYYGPKQPQIMPSPAKTTVTAKTDPSGAFSFRPDDIGYFYLRAKKDGYTQPGLSIGGPSNMLGFTLTAAEPEREARLYLVRPARVSGQVVDEQTRKPIPNLRVVAARVTNFAGYRTFMGSAGATDADGQFSVSGLAPGDYVVEIAPQKPQKERLLTKFSEDELKTVDQEFEHTYWPGGHGKEAANPVLVASGANVNVGVLPVKKTAYYRVHAHMPAASCRPGDTVSAFEFYQDSQFVQYTMNLAKAPCGNDLLITGFAPGPYRLILMLDGRSGAEREMASFPFAICDKNIEITVPLMRAIPLEGAIVAAERTKLPDLSNVTVWADPVGGIRTMDSALPVKPQEDGKLKLLAFPGADHRLEVRGLDAGHYVKEVRYAGIPVRDDLIPLSSSSGIDHSLTIVLDDKPGAVTGAVAKGDKPVSKPFLILAKWPLPAGRRFQPTASTTGDDAGKFQFGGLAPGEYRILALAARNDFDNQAPDTVERALATAKKIEIGASGFQNVALELTELR
jgi:hypothetical protein